MMLSTVDRHRKARERLGRLREILIPGFEFDDCPIHAERTLDEAYYPGLSHSALDKRNGDQVVSHSGERFFEYNTEARVDRPGAPILMVPQLWLWRIGKDLISARYRSTTQSSDCFNYQGLGDGIGVQLIGDERDPDIQAGLLIADSIDNFGKKTSTEDGSTPVAALDLFENRVVGIASEVDDYVGDGKSSVVNFAEERYFTHIISDVRSELAMVQYFLEQQERIWAEFMDGCKKITAAVATPNQAADHSPPGESKYDKRSAFNWARVERAGATIKKYQRRATKIDGDAERIEKAIQDLLNLKRTHASIEDAHNSLILSTAVIGFTVVTIVFAPLAFLTALFALKVEGFGQLQIAGADGVYNSGKLGGIFGEQRSMDWRYLILINHSECRGSHSPDDVSRNQASVLVYQALGFKKTKEGEFAATLD
jgi:signal transduction histidine kinase